MRFRADKATVEEVVAEMIELNPHLTREERMRGVKGVDPEDASRVKGDVNWGEMGINVLPESIGDLTVDGYLGLSFNNLATLPANFGSLTVGGGLGLNHNNLATLPASFGSLTVGGTLYLHNNNLATLPASFGSLQVGDEVYLGGNPVATSGPHFDGLDLVLDSEDDDY